MNYPAAFVPARGIYLLSHSVGRPPVTARQAWLDGFLDPWENGGEDVWPRWLEAIDRFRSALAALLNGDSANFCPQANLSSALSKVLPALTLADNRRAILYTEQDFPSIAFVLQQARRLGYLPRAMPGSADTLDPQAWADCMSDDVGLVLITHVQSNTGQQVPVADICARARGREIVTVVDIAQSVGVVPIDLQAWDADFAIASCVKWLCGGPGAGFLWVRPDRLADCQPIDVGWFSHENPFEFDIHNFRYARDALRFWGGTPSVQPYVIAANSIELLHGIGLDTVRQHNLGLTQQLIEAVNSDRVVTPVKAEQRGGTVVLQFPDTERQSLAARLRKAEVGFDVRATGIRLSPHIYNTADEISQVITLL